MFMVLMARLQALSYFMDFTNADVIKSVERITRAVKEHQIAPPQFMANVVAILLSKKNGIEAVYARRSSSTKRQQQCDPSDGSGEIDLAKDKRSIQ